MAFPVSEAFLVFVVLLGTVLGFPVGRPAAFPVELLESEAAVAVPCLDTEWIVLASLVLPEAFPVSAAFPVGRPEAFLGSPCLGIVETVLAFPVHPAAYLEPVVAAQSCLVTIPGFEGFVGLGELAGPMERPVVVSLCVGSAVLASVAPAGLELAVVLAFPGPEASGKAFQASEGFLVPGAFGEASGMVVVPALAAFV